MQLDRITTPAALIDYNRLLNNIETMAAKARENRVSLRPHIKTHKCIEIAKLQQEYGSEGITVSTLGEAREFIEAGFDDVTYAAPIVTQKIPVATEIAQKSSLKLLTDNRQMIDPLDNAAKEAGTILSILVKVDVGYLRCGVDPRLQESIDLVQQIVDAHNLDFEGILTHGGHSYYAKSITEVKAIAEQEQVVMIDFARKLRQVNSDLAPNTISIGSTPTITLADSIHEEISEIRPGSYVFFDATQVAIGACVLSHCALSILATVIGTYSGHFVIDAGATALSLDSGATHLDSEFGWGMIIDNYENNTPAIDTWISSLSQEHGKVKYGRESPMTNLEINDRIRIIPNHSCLAANLAECYYVVNDDSVIDTWRVLPDRTCT